MNSIIKAGIKLLIRTMALTPEQHKMLLDAGFTLRWIQSAEHGEDIFEIYA